MDQWLAAATYLRRLAYGLLLKEVYNDAGNRVEEEDIIDICPAQSSSECSAYVVGVGVGWPSVVLRIAGSLAERRASQTPWIIKIFANPPFNIAARSAACPGRWHSWRTAFTPSECRCER